MMATDLSVPQFLCAADKSAELLSLTLSFSIDHLQFPPTVKLLNRSVVVENWAADKLSVPLYYMPEARAVLLYYSKVQGLAGSNSQVPNLVKLISQLSFGIITGGEGVDNYHYRVICPAEHVKLTATDVS